MDPLLTAYQLYPFIFFRIASYSNPASNNVYMRVGTQVVDGSIHVQQIATILTSGKVKIETGLIMSVMDGLTYVEVITLPVFHR